MSITSHATDSEYARLQEENARLQQENARLRKVGDISFWEVSQKSITYTGKDLRSDTGKDLRSGVWGRAHFRGQKVAIKQLHSTTEFPHYDEVVRNEIRMMAEVRHPNLLLFIAAVLDTPDGGPLIITELFDNDLRTAYQEEILASDHVRLSILRDVAAALNYLHLQQEPIVHRDVSSVNVLLQNIGNRQWKGKLSDFGSANLARLAITLDPETKAYRAPEEGKQSPEMDVFSYGKLLCEVLTSHFPDSDDTFSSMLQSMAHEWPLLHVVVCKCVDDDPRKRPRMDEILGQLEHRRSNLKEECTSNLEEKCTSLTAIVDHLQKENAHLEKKIKKLQYSRSRRDVTVTDIKKHEPLIISGESALKDAKTTYVQLTEAALFELPKNIKGCVAENIRLFCSIVFQEAYDSCKSYLLEVFKIKLETLVTMPDRGPNSEQSADEKECYSDLQGAYGLLLSACKIKGSPAPDDKKVAEKVRQNCQTSEFMNSVPEPHFTSLIDNAVGIAWKMLTLLPPAVLCTHEKYFGDEWQTVRRYQGHKEQYYELKYFRPLMLCHAHGSTAVKAMVVKVPSSKPTVNPESDFEDDEDQDDGKGNKKKQKDQSDSLGQSSKDENNQPISLVDIDAEMTKCE